MEAYENSNWWKYLTEPMRDLAKESFTLLEREESHLRQGSGEPMHDYSFVVFPMSKAYEGFLKKLFYDLGLINKNQFGGDRFRIGKALNPNLPKRYQWDWVYDKLALACHGEETPLLMWEVWKKARNRIFHFFPDHNEFISLGQARELISEIQKAMEKALIQCDRV